MIKLMIMTVYVFLLQTSLYQYISSKIFCLKLILSPDLLRIFHPGRILGKLEYHLFLLWQKILDFFQSKAAVDAADTYSR